MNICTYLVYSKSIYSQPGYFEAFPKAGLEFFYYHYCIGLNQFLFILMMLLVPNLIGYDFLNFHQGHLSHYIEIRLSKKTYYHYTFIMNMIMTFITVLILEILNLLVIHIFYAPILFHTFDYPDLYYTATQLLSKNEIVSLICFIILTALGYSLVSSLLFSMQVIISNKYIYRCFGVIFGILLVLLPAILQSFIPIPNAAFILQINNLVALGIENVRENPFGFSNWMLYFVCFLIYSIISYLTFQALLKWRERYD